MATAIIGFNDIFTTELSHTRDSDGSTIVTWKRKVRTDVNFTAPVFGSQYLFLGSIYVYVTRVTIIRTSGEFVEVEAQLEGVGSAGSSTSGQQESIGSIAEEPIQTHPNFSSIFQAATTEGVTYDENNNFVGFNSKAQGGLAGVQSYLSPTLSYRRSYTTTTTPSLVNVGRVFNANAFADFPDVVNGANWLLTAMNFTSKAGVLTVSEDYRASSATRWNPYIYREAT